MCSAMIDALSQNSSANHDFKVICLEGDWANHGGILGNHTLGLEDGGEVPHAALVESSEI